MPSSGWSLRHRALLVTTIAAAAGCRTRLAEPELPPRFTPRVVACSDPMSVNVKLEAPVMWVASGDFNGDGAPDLVGGSKGISFTYGRGDGTFVEPSDPAEHHLPSFAAAADFDGNGIGDVVMARAGRQMELFKGSRNAPPPQVSYVAPTFNPAATGLAAGDIDGDHLPDLVVLEQEPGRRTATVLHGRDGSDFEAPFRFPLPMDPHGYVAVADLDGNGRSEVLVPLENQVWITHYLGERMRFLGWYQAFELPAPAAALAFGDFDEDGVVDMAAVAPLAAGDNVFTSRGLGNATFDAPRPLRADQSPRSLVVIDWNVDGHLDLVVANSDRAHKASFFYGRGDGTFSDPQLCDEVTFDATGGAYWGHQRRLRQRRSPRPRLRLLQRPHRGAQSAEVASAISNVSARDRRAAPRGTPRPRSAPGERRRRAACPRSACPAWP